MVDVHGEQILRDPSRTKSTAYSLEERERLGLRGLLPFAVTDLKTQQERVLKTFAASKATLNATSS